MSTSDLVTERLASARACIEALPGTLQPSISVAAEVLVRTLRAGGTVYTCGNGGSAALALHLSEELAGSYRDRARPSQRAICLNADPTLLTCIANDFGFDEVFARQGEALFQAGDLLVVFSTSGSSTNLLKVLEVAAGTGVHTMGMLGCGGGPAAASVEIPLVVQGEDRGHIQEAHLVILHILCEAVEQDACLQ